MSRFSKVLVMVLGVTLMAASVAQADHRSSCRSSGSRSSFGFSFHNQSYHAPSYSSYGSFRNYGGSGRSCYSAPAWHQQPTYIYHPTEVVRHRDHYHVQPGHYDVYSYGHWHY